LRSAHALEVACGPSARAARAGRLAQLAAERRWPSDPIRRPPGDIAGSKPAAGSSPVTLASFPSSPFSLSNGRGGPGSARRRVAAPARLQFRPPAPWPATRAPFLFLFSLFTAQHVVTAATAGGERVELRSAAPFSLVVAPPWFPLPAHACGQSRARHYRAVPRWCPLARVDARTRHGGRAVRLQRGSASERLRVRPRPATVRSSKARRPFIPLGLGFADFNSN